MGAVARVLLPIAVEKAFDFAVPEALRGRVEVGKRVRVRFRGGVSPGIVVALPQGSDHEGRLEDVLEVSDGPAFSPQALASALGVAEESFSPAGPFVNRLLPTRVRRDDPKESYVLAKELGDILLEVDRVSRRAPRQAALLRAFLAAPAPLRLAQLRRGAGSVSAPLRSLVERGLVRRVLGDGADREAARDPERNGDRLDMPETGGVLLFGQARLPGYARAARRVLKQGRGVLALAPEILQARNLRQGLERNLQTDVALYHSSVSEGERGRLWEAVRSGRVRVVVGTRSAVFLPFPALGLLVVDEEQDRSYKQEERAPRYHTRDLALDRTSDALVILGSQAPSFEAYQAAREGRLRLVRPAEEPARVAVRILDGRGERGALPMELLEAIGESLRSGRRVLLGVSRRGYFRAALCRSCGEALTCPRCGIRLAYESRGAQLVCRLCGRGEESLRCRRCGSAALRFVGTGGERIEEAVRSRFPGARVARLEAEDLRTQAEERRADEALASEAEILIGSPVIAKGPPLAGFGLVGAIGVDALLARPDFRAAEWAYQYVRGLAGRLETGEVLIPSRFPEHPALLAAVRADYDGLFASEEPTRREFRYPPFARLALLTFGGGRPNEDSVVRLEAIAGRAGVEILGPLGRLGTGGAFLLKGDTESALRTAVVAARETFPRLEVNLDPVWI